LGRKPERDGHWKSANGVTKTEIYYIITNTTDIVADVIVINQVYTGSENVYEQKDTNSRYHTNRITEDLIPTRLEKHFRDIRRIR